MKISQRQLTSESNKSSTQRQKIENANVDSQFNDQSGQHGLILDCDKIQDIKHFIRTLLMPQIKYVTQLTKEQISQIAFAFYQILIRLNLKPQTKSPKMNFMDKLLMLYKIVSKGQSIFDKNQPQQQRNNILNNYFLLIQNFLNGNNNFCKRIKQKLIKDKKFMRNILSLQLHTSDNLTCCKYISFIHSIKDLQLSQIQKRQFAKGILKNLKYFIKNNSLQILFKILKQLLIQNQKLISWILIKRYDLIHNIQTVLQSNKQGSVYSQGLDLLMCVMRKYQKAKKQFNHSNAYEKFNITKQIKELILNNHKFKYNYILYFSNCCLCIPKQEMYKLIEHFMEEFKQLSHDGEKLQQVQGQTWLQFLLQIMGYMIKKGIKQENIIVFVKNGLIQLGIGMLKLQILNQIPESFFFQLLIDCLDHLVTDYPPYYSNYYLQLTYYELKKLLQNSDHLTEQTFCLVNKLIDAYQNQQVKNFQLQ